jgi:hypothetical protein
MMSETRIQNTPPQYTGINLMANFVRARFTDAQHPTIVLRDSKLLVT